MTSPDKEPIADREPAPPARTALAPTDIRIHAMGLSVALHTQSLRHLFSKEEDSVQAVKATDEVIATATRFAAWIENGGDEGD